MWRFCDVCILYCFIVFYHVLTFLSILIWVKFIDFNCSLLLSKMFGSLMLTSSCFVILKLAHSHSLIMFPVWILFIFSVFCTQSWDIRSIMLMISFWTLSRSCLVFRLILFYMYQLSDLKKSWKHCHWGNIKRKTHFQLPTQEFLHCECNKSQLPHPYQLEAIKLSFIYHLHSYQTKKILLVSLFLMLTGIN